MLVARSNEGGGRGQPPPSPPYAGTEAGSRAWANARVGEHPTMGGREPRAYAPPLARLRHAAGGPPGDQSLPETAVPIAANAALSLFSCAASLASSTAGFVLSSLLMKCAVS